MRALGPLRPGSRECVKPWPSAGGRMSTRIPIPPRPLPDPADWIQPLLAEDTRKGVAAALVAIALRLPGCEAASLLWEAGDAVPRLLAGTPPDPAAFEQPRDAHAGAPCSDLRTLVLPLAGVPARLLLRACSAAQLPALQ